jgi:hypothetical protein
MICYLSLNDYVFNLAGRDLDLILDASSELSLLRSPITLTIWGMGDATPSLAMPTEQKTQSIPQYSGYLANNRKLILLKSHIFTLPLSGFNHYRIIN